MDAWLVVLITVQVIFVGFVLWLVVHYRQRRDERRAEERLRLMERFDSGDALAEFLRSESGDKMLELFRQPAPNPRIIWALSVYAGLISLFLGLGFTALALLGVESKGESLLMPASLILSIGLGFLVASRFCRDIFRPPTDAP